MNRPTLSVIMPFYKKCFEFARVLPMNSPFLAKEHIEVIIAMDESSELPEVLNLIRSQPQINWKLLACYERHAWRPPCKAINVGIRAASRDFILVVSPESAFVGDLPGEMLRRVVQDPNLAICGRLSHGSFDELDRCGSLFDLMLRYQATHAHKVRFFGSIMVSRAKAEEVCGYDECISSWGGDDDNFRARLLLAGVQITKSSELNIVHLSVTPREPRGHQKTPEEIRCLVNPETKACPMCSPRWGAAFSHEPIDWTTACEPQATE